MKITYFMAALAVVGAAQISRHHQDDEDYNLAENVPWEISHDEQHRIKHKQALKNHSIRRRQVNPAADDEEDKPTNTISKKTIRKGKEQRAIEEGKVPKKKRGAAKAAKKPSGKAAAKKKALAQLRKAAKPAARKAQAKKAGKKA